MTYYDDFDDLFPGPAAAVPDDAERDRADALIAEWSARWREPVRTIARVYETDGRPTNRAFLRSRLRRWWRGAPDSDTPGKS